MHVSFEMSEYTGDIHKKIVVSPENGRKHVEINPDGRFEVRHYHLDGEIVRNECCCDYLLANDSMKKVYYIELKGRDIGHAIEQLQAGEEICRASFAEYSAYYRIVSSKTRTQQLNSVKFRHFQKNVGSDRIKVATNEMKEILD